MLEPSNERFGEIAEEMSLLALNRFGPERAVQLKLMIEQAARSVAFVRDSHLDEVVEPDFLHPIISE